MPNRSGKPTLAMVAKAAGVSVSTASLAFSGAGPITDDTRKKVFDAAKELGYHGPNPLGRQLRSGRSGIVGVVLGDNPGRVFRDPVSLQVLDGLMEELGEHGLGVLLVPGVSPDHQLTAVPPRPQPGDPVRPNEPIVDSAAMDVAVMIWGVIKDEPNLTMVTRRGIPVVIGDGHPVEGAPLVGIDDRAAAALAIRHLTDLGHKRIAEITLPFGYRPMRAGFVSEGDLSNVTRFVTQQRAAGFRDVIQPVMTWEASGSLVEHGRDATIAIMGAQKSCPNRPTAIFAQSDQLAAGVVLGARELGLRVPEDISVVGFDGLQLPWLAPDVLTTVRQPLWDKGAAIGRAVVGVLAGEPASTVHLPVELVVGTTTAAPSS